MSDSRATPPRPDRVGNLLAEVLRKLGLDKELERQGALARWDGIVGERISAVTSAVAVSKGVLFVEVSSSAWLSELNLMRRDILERLNAGAGEGRVERIVFSLAERAAGAEGATPEAEAPS